jgi:hypothetical protein
MVQPCDLSRFVAALREYGYGSVAALLGVNWLAGRVGIGP